jgi:predicted site-specific integrase-resolvase
MNAKRKSRVALYVRVSTDGQTVANQEHELRKVAEAKGWEIVEVYCDNGVSGAKGRRERKGLDRALKEAVQGRYDVLAAWSVDRPRPAASKTFSTRSRSCMVSAVTCIIIGGPSIPERLRVGRCSKCSVFSPNSSDR